MRVELHQADRPILGNGAQDRQRHGMVAAYRDRRRVQFVQVLEERLDRGEAGRQVHGVDRDVADIGDLAQIERRDPAGRMHQPDRARRLPHRGRPAARSGAIVGAEVERHADQRNVDPGTGRHARRAQQRCHVAEAGRNRGVHGPQAAIRVHGVLQGLFEGAISCHPGAGVHNPGDTL